MATGALIVGGILGAVRAHADPGDDVSIPQVALHVCEQIEENPTVQTVLSVVGQLYAVGNTRQQEEDVMYYAMHQTCPQYAPLAEAAVIELSGGKAT
jgi:hypothetical protein